MHHVTKRSVIVFHIFNTKSFNVWEVTWNIQLHQVKKHVELVRAVVTEFLNTLFKDMIINVLTLRRVKLIYFIHKDSVIKSQRAQYSYIRKTNWLSICRKITVVYCTNYKEYINT